MTTRLYTHDLSIEHITPPGHPERPDRIKVLDKIFADPAFEKLERIEAPRANSDYFELVHPAEFLKKIKNHVRKKHLIENYQIMRYQNIHQCLKNVTILRMMYLNIKSDKILIN